MFIELGKLIEMGGVLTVKYQKFVQSPYNKQSLACSCMAQFLEMPCIYINTQGYKML